MFGEHVKMCEFCGCVFFNVILNAIIFSMERGYESIFRFVSILFYRDFKCNYFLV